MITEEFCKIPLKVVCGQIWNVLFSFTQFNNIIPSIKLLNLTLKEGYFHISPKVHLTNTLCLV